MESKIKSVLDTLPIIVDASVIINENASELVSYISRIESQLHYLEIERKKIRQAFLEGRHEQLSMYFKQEDCSDE